jgi:hypothetical protein
LEFDVENVISFPIYIFSFSCCYVRLSNGGFVLCFSNS